MSFFTIGHSTRTIPEFVDLLKENGVEMLVDVRTVPYSRRVPHFNTDTIGATLSDHGIGYEHVAKLGGWRKKSCCDEARNGYWTHKSFRNYADYALTEGFREGLKRLRDLGDNRVVAYMCSEAVWWRCHRRIITDHLIAQGVAVRHIMGPGAVVDAELNAGAVVGSDLRVTYPSTDEPRLI